MLKYLPVIVTVAGTLGAAFLTPAFVAAHPAAFALVNAAAQVLHSVLPSIFGYTSTPAEK
jgi:hypothetical protein